MGVETVAETCVLAYSQISQISQFGEGAISEGAISSVVTATFSARGEPAYAD
jgi:hypothetical protein